MNYKIPFLSFPCKRESRFYEINPESGFPPACGRQSFAGMTADLDYFVIQSRKRNMDLVLKKAGVCILYSEACYPPFASLPDKVKGFTELTLEKLQSSEGVSGFLFR